MKEHVNLKLRELLESPMRVGEPREMSPRLRHIWRGLRRLIGLGEHPRGGVETSHLPTTIRPTTTHQGRYRGTTVQLEFQVGTGLFIYMGSGHVFGSFLQKMAQHGVVYAKVDNEGHYTIAVGSTERVSGDTGQAIDILDNMLAVARMQPRGEYLGTGHNPDSWINM